MLTAERRQFLTEYGRIREAEGRGSESAEYYRALPYADLTGRNSDQWKMRAKSFDYFARHILPQRTCDSLDLGAGNCWLSHRLAVRGHRSVAVDIFADSRDGLGAFRQYPYEFPAVEAEFDSLPFPSKSFDLAVFASSFQYSVNFARTLAEAGRCLRPGGKIAIIDSPVYFRREHGVRMREERHRFFEATYGFRSDAVPSIEFIDVAMLDLLRAELGLKWRIYRPWYGWQWHLRPWKARLAGKRPPSRFWILIAEFKNR
jgi:SAM-dependent methyltransferase